VPDSIANLPTTIFETKGVELKVGLLNTNAPSNGAAFENYQKLFINQ
jgi:hypothetical protein